VAGKKPSDSTGVFLAHLAVLAALVVVLSLTFVTYMETLWMKVEIKKEAQELRRLKEEVKKEQKPNDQK
jgi:predicted amino acid-binding ACT domain protein